MGWAIYYHIQNGEAAILRCVGDDAPLVLRETIEGCPVTAIGPDCFGAGGTETEERGPGHSTVSKPRSARWSRCFAIRRRFSSVCGTMVAI